MDHQMNYFYISGTSSGIGKAITEKLLSFEENVVYGFSRRNIFENPNYYHTFCDLSDFQATEKISFLSFPLTDAKKIVLINNAGRIQPLKHFGNFDSTEFAKTLQLNLMSPCQLMNDFVRTYRNHDALKLIVNISSGAAHIAYDGWAAYAASKAALNIASEVLHTESKLDKSAFYVFAVAPGIIDTPMQDQIREVSPDDFSEVARFLELKENHLLHDAEALAIKILNIIQSPEKQKNCVLSL